MKSQAERLAELHARHKAAKAARYAARGESDRAWEAYKASGEAPAETLACHEASIRLRQAEAAKAEAAKAVCGLLDAITGNEWQVVVTTIDGEPTAFQRNLAYSDRYAAEPCSII